MAQSNPAAVRSYRIYFRDTLNALTPGYEVDLRTDGEARELAAQMLEERADYTCAEIWDRARLVCTVSRDGA